MQQQKSDGGILLGAPVVRIRRGHFECACPCRITFNLARNQTVQIECMEGLPIDVVQYGPAPFLVDIPLCPKAIECFPVKTRLDVFDGKGYATLLPRYSNILLDHSRPLFRVNAGIVNLGQYWFGSRPNRRFELSDNIWTFELSVVDEDTVQYPPAIQDD